MIRKATENDAKCITNIYNHYILRSTATFETETVTSVEMVKRIHQLLDSRFPWLVAEDKGKCIGYAYGSKWNKRKAYDQTAEVTVYVAPNRVTQGIGTALYTSLFEELRSLRYHSIIGVITLPNPASVALHEKFGMKRAGEFNEVGYKFGQWLNVGYWQCVL